MSEVPNGILSRSSNIKEEVREGGRCPACGLSSGWRREERTMDALGRDPGPGGGKRVSSPRLSSVAAARQDTGVSRRNVPSEILSYLLVCFVTNMLMFCSDF